MDLAYETNNSEIIYFLSKIYGIDVDTERIILIYNCIKLLFYYFHINDFFHLFIRTLWGLPSK